MSSYVDRRVVEMEFDNRQFESNVQTSMSTLDKLKQSLSWTNGYNGLDGISGVAKGFNLSGIETAVETVQEKFSAMEIFAITALSNIANSAVNAGKKIVSALTIDPIKTGFSEYELKMNSVQTIMAGCGENLETVNKYLEELNLYADRTIYSFSDMTQNIGKFTNAGVKLEDAVSAIQGVSNVAAVSGANAGEASRAMYNFAQALSAGYVKLIDWKSIENANMATVGFKDQLLETAVALGTVTKSSDGMYKTLSGNTFNATKNFNEVLTDQWMTTEVLVGTLKKYADETTEIGTKAFAAAQDVKTFSQLYDTLKESAQSGWAQSWEILVGDFEEAKAFLTEINGIIGGLLTDSANARNDILQGWKTGGGRTDLIDALRNSFEALMAVIKPVSEAFKEIFPPITSEQLIQFTKSLKELTSKFKISDETAEKLKRTFKGFYAVIDILKQSFEGVVKVLTPLIDVFLDVGGSLLDITSRWGDFWVQLDTDIKKAGKITGFFETLGKTIKDVVDILKQNVDLPLFDRIGSIFDSERFKGITGTIGQSFVDMKDKLVKSFKEIGDVVSESALVKSLEKIYEKTKDVFVKILGACGDFAKSVGAKLSSIELGDVLDTAGQIIAGGIGVNIIKFIKSLSGSVEGFGGIGKNIGDLFSGLKDCLKSYQTQLNGETLIKIAEAIGILALSLLVLSTIDSKKLSEAIGAMTILFGELVGSLKILESFGGVTKLKDTIKTISVMTAVATSMLILTAALSILAKLDFQQMMQGLVGVGALMGMMVSVSKALSNNADTVIKGSGSMVIFATAMLILASAVKKLGTLEWDELAKGLVGVGGLLAGVSLFINKTDFQQKTISTATGILILSAALNVMAAALKIFGSMEWDEIGRGLTALGLSLGIVMAGMRLMPDNLPLIGLGLMEVSASLVVLGAAMKIFGSMDWDEIGRGLVGLGGSLGILSVTLNLMTGTLSGSAALLVAAGALAILAPTLVLLGTLSWEAIAKGLVAIAGAFTIIGIAGAVLQPVVPAILALAGALTLIGVGVLAAGVGVTALATGFAALVTAISGGASAIVLGLTTIVTAIADLIPTVIGKIGEGVIAFAKVISDGAPALGEASIALARVLITAFTETIPELVDAILQFCQAILITLVDKSPGIIQSGIDLTIAFLKGIKDNICQVVPIVIDIILETLKAIAAKIPDIVQAGIDIVVNLIDGLAIGIEENAPRIRDAFVHLFESLLTAVLVFLGIKSPSKVFAEIGTNIINGLINGIKNMSSKAVDSIKSVISSVVSAVKGKVSDFTSVGKNLISGLTSGIKKAASGVISAAKGVVKDAVSAAKKLLGIKSPSKVFEEIGINTDKGFIKGLNGFASKVANASGDVGTGAVEQMKDVMSKITTYLSNGVDVQPAIRPVVDLSDVSSRAKKINSMLYSNRSINLAGKASVTMNDALLNRQNAVKVSDDKYSSVVKDINTIMDKVVTSMSKYKVVMDSGALVGQMVSPLDTALGSRVTRNWREREA